MGFIDSRDNRGIKLMGAGLVGILFAVPVATFLWMTSVPGHSYSGQLPLPTAAQATLANMLRADVQAIASQPHNMRHPRALEKAAIHIERSLAMAGYKVQRHPFVVGRSTVRNIEVTIDPVRPDAETLVVGAHYDSAGDAPGANDNGTGSAALLALARKLAPLQGKAQLRLRFVFFVNEEPPHFQTPSMGSVVYARALRQSAEKVRGMISLETIGYYSDRAGSQHYPPPLGMRYPGTGNFVAFVGTISSRGFVRRTVAAFRDVASFPSVGGSAPGFIQGISWSDHWSFAEEGFPALMVTDTAPFRYPYYHTAEDTPDKVDYSRLALVVTGLEQMIYRWAT